MYSDNPEHVPCFKYSCFLRNDDNGIRREVIEVSYQKSKKPVWLRMLVHLDTS